MQKARDPSQISMTEERIVDSFSGGGGASSGIELATGRVVDVAINHDKDAILMHSVNHPFTKHLWSERICLNGAVERSKRWSSSERWWRYDR